MAADKINKKKKYKLAGTYEAEIREDSLKLPDEFSMI